MIYVVKLLNIINNIVCFLYKKKNLIIVKLTKIIDMRIFYNNKIQI